MSVGGGNRCGWNIREVGNWWLSAINGRRHVLISLLRRVWVDNDDMAFLKVVDKRMHVGKVYTAALVIAALQSDS